MKHLTIILPIILCCIFCIVCHEMAGQARNGASGYPISFNAQSYTVNNQPFYLYAGEFDYFRVPKPDWRRRMSLFKQAGGNCIATYIPWILHEPEEDKFVFTGQDFYDLEGFLQTAKEEGLYVIVRPGPYVYSELRNFGVPQWLFSTYPELRAMNHAGETMEVASYLHPQFLKRVEKWFDQVCPIIAKYTVANGGSVAFVQLDNECGGVQIWNKGMDYNPVSMGFGKADGLYPQFLHKKYTTIDNLNVAYHTAFQAFSGVEPFPVTKAVSIEQQRRAKDYAEFYFHTTSIYFQKLAAMVRKQAIEVPFVTNSWNTDANMNFYESSKLLGNKEMLIGVDHYYNLGQDWAPVNNPDPQYAIRVFQSLESLRLLGMPPTVWEFPGGSLSDWPPITPVDVEACLMLHLAYGMKGLSYYIFTGGANPQNLGLTTDVYDYKAAISADGRITPLYDVEKKVGLFLKANPWLATAARQHDCRIGFNYRMQRSRQYWVHKGEFLLTDPDAFIFLQKGMINTLFCENYSPIFTDLGDDSWVGDVETPFIVVSSSCMSAADQRRIVAFLKNGGHVLLCPVIPEYDDDFNPCTFLKDFLGSPQISENTLPDQRLSFQTVKNVYKNQTDFVTDHLPGNAVVLGEDENHRLPVAWSLVTEGNGKIVFLGMKWYHQMNEHSAMLREMLNELKVEKIVTSSNPNIFTSLRSDGQQSMLFVLNLYSSPMETAIQVRRQNGKIFSTGTLKLAPMSVKTINIK